MKHLNVWFGQLLLGELAQEDTGQLSFRYLPSYLEDLSAPAISVSLPKAEAPFGHQACLPFFDGLLPESFQRSAAAQALGISEGNTFAMLDRLGGEVAGALAFLPPDELPKSAKASWAPVSLDDVSLMEILSELPVRPLLAGSRGLRLSLAGAQSKLPVCVVNGQVCLPGPEQPSTHILKPAMPKLSATTENEAFAMTLAAELGLHTAKVEARILDTDKGRVTYLLVERCDRICVDGVVHRLHQEDFCQALGIPSIWKYQGEGGPSMKQCFDLIRQVSTLPGLDLSSLLDVAIFNVIIGNADAHGKNFSLLYTKDGLRLAPFYDLMSTIHYPGFDPSFAMKVGDQSAFERMGILAWKGFAKHAGLTYPYVRNRIMELTQRVQAACGLARVRFEARGFDDASLEQISNRVVERAERLEGKLKMTSGD